MRLAYTLATQCLTARRRSMDPRRRAAVALAPFGFVVEICCQNRAKRHAWHVIPCCLTWLRISEVRCRKFQMAWGDLKPFYFPPKKESTKSTPWCQIPTRKQFPQLEYVYCTFVLQSLRSQVLPSDVSSVFSGSGVVLTSSVVTTGTWFDQWTWWEAPRVDAGTGGSVRP